MEQKLEWSTITNNDEYVFSKTPEGTEIATLLWSEIIEEAPYRKGYLVRLTRIECDEDYKEVRYESLTFIPG